MSGAIHFMCHRSHCKLSSDGSLSSDPTVEHHKSNVGVIVGPVVAAVAVIALVIAAFLWHRRHRRQTEIDEFPSPAQPAHIISGEKGLNPPFYSSNMLLPHPYTQFYETPRGSDMNFAAATSSQQDVSHPHSHVSGPSVSSNPPTESSRSPPTDVNIDAIMEMIAQRIDLPRNVDASLPRYREQ